MSGEGNTHKPSQMDEFDDADAYVIAIRLEQLNNTGKLKKSSKK